MSRIHIGIVGVGNCASSFIQGLAYYEKHPGQTGLCFPEIGGYRPEDISVTSAFDVDMRKVGKPLKEAIWASPNCTRSMVDDIRNHVTVRKGPLLDGVSSHTQAFSQEKRVLVSEEPPCDVVSVLKESGTEILLNFLPVGSELASSFYAEAALKAGVALINCIPVFIGSDRQWIKKFEKAGLPLIGDDIKTQVGATIVHRVLAHLFQQKGVRLDRTYQLNFGGNTDFLNMLNHERLGLKKKSKTEAVQSQTLPLPDENIHIGPSDYISWMKDNKVCHIRMEGTQFGGMPVHLDLKLSVEDSPNCAGVVVDAVRGCKMALERGWAGEIAAVSSFAMKHPRTQRTEEEAFYHMQQLISG